MTFQDLKLSPSIQRALAECGYTEPTPIQAQAIPLALQGRDLIASAQTGTGKTAAFVLPALMRLEEQKPVRRSAPRVLVLTPTRELAAQITDNAKLYGKHLRISQGCIVGGVAFGPQLRLLSQRVDLLVATPGRLIDHIERGSVDLRQVELLVLDEADRMLDMGFIHAVRKIASLCPKDRQTLLFTATWDNTLAKLGAELLRDPVRIEIAPAAASEDAIEQRLHLADDSDHKERLLRHILDSDRNSQVLIFAATKRRVDRLARRLEGLGHSVGALHGDMKQNARQRTLDLLKTGKLRLLVATDVAGRGIDVSKLGMVVNFDLPKVAEDYVHRIGRTGRAGASGVAISLVGPEDVELLPQIDRYLKKPVPRAVISGLEPVIASERPARGAAPTKARPGSRGSNSRNRNGGRNQQPRKPADGGGRGAGDAGMPAFLTRKAR